MKQKPEAKLQSKFIKLANSLGWYCSHLSPPHDPGFPDLVAKQGNQSRFIELKSGTDLRADQIAWMVQQKPYGIYVWVLSEITDPVIKDISHTFDLKCHFGRYLIWHYQLMNLESAIKIILSNP